MYHSSSININGKQNTGEVMQASTISSNNKSEGLNQIFQEGQVITGKAIQKNEFITFDFQGKQINIPEKMVQNIQVGQSMTFLIRKVEEQLIELEELREERLEESKSKNGIRIDKDKETYEVKREMDHKSTQKDNVVHGIIGKMTDVLKQITELDLINLRKEGFSIDSMDVHQLHDGIQRMKEREAGHLGQKDHKSTDIEKRLIEENIPVTKDGIQQIQTALTLAGVIPQMNNNTSHYLISNEMSPTIENIYKAHYNGNSQPYQVKNPLSEVAWNQLKPQVTQVIQEAGYEVNEQTLGNGRWLLEGDMALTARNLTYMNVLEHVKGQWNSEYGMDQIVSGLKDGIAPKDIVVGGKNGPSYDEIVEKISNIQDNTITHAIHKNIPLTMESLDQLQKELKQGSKAVEQNEIPVDSKNDAAYQEIKAKRQLEEIRLMMTKEAANTLEKKGFHIETESLEKVVEELRALEKHHYQRLCEEAGLEGTEEQIQTISQTRQQISYLMELPSYVLSRTLEDRLTHTVPSLVEAGTQLKNELIRAGEAYDTLMTIPNREYGDSIQKAFANMAPLLDELNILDTAENQRAVRMLAYNHMEINQANIDHMKVYDGQVSNLVKNLNPAVTVQLLKEGINPLDVPINELSEKINNMMKEQSLTTEDKYSVYLQKLEKTQGISEAERKSYIGIYRLLYQVEKSDGAAIGALVKSEREITLNHLLTAVKTMKKGSIDSVIDDDFGLLESAIRSKETILEQVAAAFQEEEAKNDIKQQTVQSEAQEEVKKELYQKLLRDLINELSPDKLSGLGQGINQGANELATQEQRVWTLIKDQPLERLLEDMKQIQAEEQVEEEIAKESIVRLRNIYQNSEQSVKFLNQFKVPHTPVNIQLAKQLLSEGFIDIKKAMKKDENIQESLEDSLKEMTNLADNLVDKSSMNEAYDNLLQSAKETLEQVCGQENVSSVNITQLKLIGTQMTFLKALAEKEYYQVPVETQQGVIHMNVTIIRNENARGKVSITVPSEDKGLIKADFTMNEGMLKGFVYCEGRKELEDLKSILPTVEQQLAEEGIPVKQINVTLNRKEIEILEKNTTQEIETQGQHNNNREIEKDLYQVARTFVRLVQQIYNEE